MTGRRARSTTWCSAPRCRGCCRTPSATCRASTRSSRHGRAGAGGWASASARSGDLEHWQAFRASFDRLTRMITGAATGAGAPATHQRAVRRRPPQLRRSGRPARSGDDPTAAVVHQLTCSPVHNVVAVVHPPLFRLGWSRGSLARMTGRLGRTHRGAAGGRDLAQARRAAVRQHHCDARDRRAARDGDVPQPRSAGSVVEVARLGLAHGPSADDAAAARPARHGCNRAVIDRVVTRRVRAARSG